MKSTCLHYPHSWTLSSRCELVSLVAVKLALTKLRFHVIMMQTSSTSLGQGGSNWQPPEWAVEFKNGVHVLEVVKDGTVVDKISLEKRRALFGRQAIMCDYVLDHPSVSRQHAVVVQHKNGRYNLILSFCC